MLVVRNNLYGLLNENMDQARSALKRVHIPELDPRFQELKQMLLDDNKIGYIGKFTKWLFEDHESWEKITEIYDMLKAHPTKVPPINTFKKLEDLFDFLQGSAIDTKLNQVINAIPSNARKNVSDKLKKLIELNIKYANAIKDFYSKKGGKFNNSQDLYNDTVALIENLSGKFNLETILKKIKDTKSKVEILLALPDILVIRPLDYHASNELGSKSWCISYSQNYWDSYADAFSTQYFIFDFSKSIDDKKSMIGITVNPDGSYKAAHFKDDSVCPTDYAKSL
jgi:hypothetical protein